MSVPAGKRGKSSTEFFHSAYKLNDSITQLLIRDFGVRSISRDLKTFTHCAKMSKEDRENFSSICDKYHIDVEAEYPLWVIEHYRNVILNILAEMINNITQANTIYPDTMDDLKLRKAYQWKAIANCYQLLQHFQTAIRILPVDVNRYAPYVDMINKEIASLKDWKKSDNKIKKRLEESINNTKEQ